MTVDTFMAMRQWLILAIVVLVGASAGLGAYTFTYAKGYSYLLDDPEACANCHIMDDHFSAWLKSSHRVAATCNGCHTPHAFVSKYMVKASNGFWHSFYFTTGRFPDPIRITEPNQTVVEANCRDCHARLTESIDHAGSSADRTAQAQALTCTRCHRHVGHWLR